VLRRSFTVPANIANRPKPAASSPSTDGDGGIETLFTHYLAKIVSFTTAPDPSKAPHARRPSVVLDIDTPGSIPWASYTERTLAAGTIQLQLHCLAL
jgi:hypothetical protein